jgi:hypothetical protein
MDLQTAVLLFGVAFLLERRSICASTTVGFDYRTPKRHQSSNNVQHKQNEAGIGSKGLCLIKRRSLLEMALLDVVVLQPIVQENRKYI